MSTARNQPPNSESGYVVEHRPNDSRFVVVRSGRTSNLDYLRTDNKIRLTHTLVPPADRGQGIAEALTRRALHHAEDNNLRVVPDCSYVRSFIEKHDEFQHLVAEPPR